ncbi:unnamed protein product [Moneuplotes crassus]|uniref:Cyclic nucleotide-binding domain-containing protein n=1 Tax=Euplotes crassus TaxID=5936 RepID=A0AAD1UJT7_EUPCR|nr:unnamed protein product [Moneuplotes crassus]
MDPLEEFNSSDEKDENFLSSDFKSQRKRRMSRRNNFFEPGTKFGNQKNYRKSSLFADSPVVKSARKLIRSQTKLRNYDKKMSEMSFDNDRLEIVSNTNSNPNTNREKNDDEHLIPTKRKCSLFMLQNRSKKRIRWDLFIMLLATWNCFSVPYNVAFDSTVFPGILSDILNWFIDIFFMLDILMNFRTTINDDETGGEISDPFKIAFNYLKGKFWIDLLASIPFDFFSVLFISSSNNFILQLFGLLKLVRILRLSRLITYMNLQDDVKMSLKLGKLIFFLIMYIHCIGCLWFFIAKQNETWMPPLDYVWVETHIYTENAFHQYCNSLYHAMLMLGGNDIGPRGSFQLAFITSLLFAGAIINANIFGNIAVLLQQLNRKATKFQEKVENANAAMKNLSIPSKIQFEVQRYLDYTQSTSDHQQELKNFLGLIPPSLSELVVKHISEQALNKNEVFQNNSNILDSILTELVPCQYTPEDAIVRQGEKAENIYFLCKGECDVLVTDQSLKESFVKELHQGAYFGEIALLKNCRRTATVKSKNFTTLVSLDSQSFLEMVSVNPDIAESMNKHIKVSYKDRWKKFIKRALCSIEYFSGPTSDEIIEALAYKLEILNINKDTTIFQNGKPCTEIYIVAHGEVNIYIKNSQVKDSYLDMVYQGCSIGSYSVLTGDDYSITGKAKTDCTLLKLTYNTLEELRNKFDELDYILSEFEDYIEAEGLPFCDFKLYRAGFMKMKPLKKFQIGIRRIIQIVKSHKTHNITRMFNKIQDDNKKAREDKNKTKKAIVLRKASVNPMAAAKMADSERKDPKYSFLSSKIDKLTRIVEKQHEIIQDLRNDIREKFGLEKLKTEYANDVGKSSHDFSSEYSDDSTFNKKFIRNKSKNDNPERSLSQFSHKNKFKKKKSEVDNSKNFPEIKIENISKRTVSQALPMAKKLPKEIRLNKNINQVILDPPKKVQFGSSNTIKSSLEINKVEEYIENDDKLLKGSQTFTDKSQCIDKDQNQNQTGENLNNTEMEMENLLIDDEVELPDNMKRLTTDEINDILTQNLKCPTILGSPLVPTSLA